MGQVLSSSWALLLGVMLLMVGNGLQGTLLGVRGEIEGFSTWEMSMVMSAYFVGFLGGSRMAPEMIRRVGHVRVFAALGSFISAVLILYPTIANPYAWVVGRIIIGFCFSGVYVTAESWLNNSATNETRGQTLSAYMIVQMLGIVSAQGLLLVADPSGFVLFVIPSVLVSISFAPILLSISPTPAFESTKPMTLRRLYESSPLGVVGMFLLGGIFASQAGMSAVFAASVGMSLYEVSLFVAAFYVGALIAQYPLGWLSDRMERRRLVIFVALGGAAAAALAYVFGRESFWVLIAAAVVIGGLTNPLYSILIAHTNDYLDFEDMAAASGGLIFINGLGAIAGPLIVGWIMERMGVYAYFLFPVVLLVLMAGYSAWRTTQRAAVSADDALPYTPVSPTASIVTVEAAGEYAYDAAQEEDEE